MPLFQIAESVIKPIAQSNFSTEKALQSLTERNLNVVFNCRFVASEFSTGAKHAGRIDTLALSEDDNPVIIEYKKSPSSELVIQSLFYLAWLNDHRGDFQIAAQTTLGSDIHIDWSEIRVICIAPNYKKYDLHAVQMMGTAIELWTYRHFANRTFYLEEVVRDTSDDDAAPSKNSVMVAAGKKAAITRAIGGWTLDQHFSNKSPEIKQIAEAVQEFMFSLDPAVEELPKKLYIAYRTTQNIVCMETQQHKVLLYIKLDPRKHPGPAKISRDVSKIGHYGTGNLEITLKSTKDVELAKQYLQIAYEQVGV